MRQNQQNFNIKFVLFQYWEVQRLKIQIYNHLQTRGKTQISLTKKILILQEQTPIEYLMNLLLLQFPDISKITRKISKELPQLKNQRLLDSTNHNIGVRKILQKPHFLLQLPYVSLNSYVKQKVWECVRWIQFKISNQEKVQKNCSLISTASHPHQENFKLLNILTWAFSLEALLAAIETCNRRRGI